MNVPTMNKPTIRYYARMDYDPESKETPKYVVAAETGSYPPMGAIIGRNGKVTMRLKRKRNYRIGQPELELEAKNSLNFTGLKFSFVGGKLSGYAYGNPHQKPTYSKHNKPNPFFDYRQDGYLFIVHGNKQATTDEEKAIPSCIELLVLAGAKKTVEWWCTSLRLGGFNDELKRLRAQAKEV